MIITKFGGDIYDTGGIFSDAARIIINSYENDNKKEGNGWQCRIRR